MNEQRPVAPQGIPQARPTPAHAPAHHGPAKITAMPMQSHGNEPDLTPLGLVDEPELIANAGPTPSKIRAFGQGTVTPTHTFKRQTTVTGHGACRVRSFHGRLSDEGMEYMDTKINDWLDHHPDVEVKIVTTSIGQYEGKIREPALVVNIWY
jgi:hypothetical protein